MSAKIFIFCLAALAVINTSLATSDHQCPPAQTITPCLCNASTQQISCRGGTTNLGEVFGEFAKHLPKSEQTFHSFYLNSRDITRLESNAFKGVKFRAIFLGGSKLTYIHKDAFRGTEHTVKELYAFATNISLSSDEAYNVFAAISSLVNLQKLVISGSNIHKIPDRAFRPASKNQIQRNLTEIEFGLGFTPTIKEIGFAPFADLPALHSISFSGQQINQIRFHAFSFHETSNKTITIDLTGNNLKSDSFEVGAFLGAQRPVKIHFGLTSCNNNIEFLNQTVFEPFLDENRLNSIDIGRKCRNIICDCRMDWVLYGSYEERIKHLKCRDGRTIKDSRDRFNSDYNISSCIDNEEALANKLEEELDKVLTDLFKSSGDEEEEMDYNSLDKDINERPDDMCTTKDCIDTSTEMSKYLNTSIDPCDDFYTYACGKWEDNHLIPLLTHILSHGGVEYDNFVRLRQQVDLNLDLVLSQDITTDDPLAVQYAMSMYQTCKDNQYADIDAMQRIIRQIGGWPIVDGRLSDGYDWMKSLQYIFTNFRSDIIVTFESFINADSVRQLKIDHSSFLLSPHRLLDISSLSSLRDLSSYVKYIHNVAVMLGATESNLANNDTVETALEIVKFESELAKISDKSDGKEFFIERNLDSLKCVIPEVDWFALFTNLLADSGLDMKEFGKTKVVYDIHYMIRVSQLLKNSDPKVIANYLGWRVVETFGFLAGGPLFLESQQVFHNIQSNEKTKTLWKQCLNSLQNYLPLALTRKYAENFLPPKDKQNVTQIVKHVKQAFINLIDQKEWIDDSKRNFTVRVDKIVENVAYPDWIFDDKQFNKYHNNFTKSVSNNQNNQQLTKLYTNLWKYWNKQLLTSIGEKVDKTYYWDQSPLYVGASYDIMDNIISLPLGILHPPFYYTDRPAYLNYGTVGAIIGHEISHGSMPRYNTEEVLMHPWNQTTLKSFLTKAKCFVDQYSSYFDDLTELNLDGLKTFEEDMSDVAGLKASFLAFESYAKPKQQTGIKLLPSLSMYSYKQLFFMVHAQKWCRYITTGQVRTKILKGVHSPEKYRVNGAIANFDEFSNAFNCPLGSKMNPDVKCELW